VPVYNLDNQDEYPPTSISNLCSEDYFYGDSEVEKSMDGLEGAHARVINDLRCSRSFDTLDEMEIFYFTVFVLFQRNRTKRIKKETEDLIDDISKEYLKLKVESGEVDPELPDGRNALDLLDRYKVTHEAPLAIPMLQALTGAELILDLEVAIIENKSEEPFVISDHPVIHDNRRFKDEVEEFLIGVQSRGLQIFIPISDEVQIMLYDPAAYFVDYTNKQKRKVTTASEEVARGLNDIQMISAFESIYYRREGQGDKFRSAQQRLSKYIEEKRTKFARLGPEEHKFDTDNEIIESGRYPSEYSPHLPFVKQRMNTSFSILRMPEVYERHKEHMNEIIEDAREKRENK
jgi:hypothetical protein